MKIKARRKNMHRTCFVENFIVNKIYKTVIFVRSTVFTEIAKNLNLAAVFQDGGRSSKWMDGDF